ncbi:MAG: putative Ig domain-containing protein [Bryobacterales bacterium]|nr:putative Ig domain-containing protein [Bryobacterales bacterium]MBV9397644.1 putative Ig domain-containing protein [Bryobacterales bacterium]
MQLTAEVASGAVVPLFATDASVHVPDLIEGRPHQSVVSFQAIVDTAAKAGTVAIRAGSDESSIEERISVLRNGPTLSVPDKQFAAIGKRLSFTVTAAFDTSSTGILSATGLPAGANFDPATGIFDWVPEESQSGIFNVRFSAADASGRSAFSDVSVQTGSGAPVLDRLENAASGAIDSVCSGGSLAKLRGGWLSAQARVSVNGAAAPVLHASSTEVTFLCPDGPAGAPLSIAVETEAGQPGTLTTALSNSALGIFTVDGSANGQAAARILGGSQIAMARNYRFAGQPAQSGDVLEIPVTGLRADCDPGLISVRAGDLELPAEWVRPGTVAGVVVIGITLPAAAPAGNAIPLSVRRRLPSGEVATSQQTTIAIEAIQQ